MRGGGKPHSFSFAFSFTIVDANRDMRTRNTLDYYLILPFLLASALWLIMLIPVIVSLSPVLVIIMHEFGDVSSLIEASLDSLSMGCPIDSVCSFLWQVILVPHLFHQCLGWIGIPDLWLVFGVDSAAREMKLSREIQSEGHSCWAYGARWGVFLWIFPGTCRLLYRHWHCAERWDPVHSKVFLVALDGAFGNFISRRIDSWVLWMLPAHQLNDTL